jgi:hypothetical protein
MRLSKQKHDVGYVPGHNWVARVYLDDVAVDVFTADEERGLVIAPLLDDEGRPRIDRARRKCLEQTRYGRVRIEIDAASRRVLGLTDQ